MSDEFFENSAEEAEKEPKKRYRKSARDKIMDFLARRLHSELELRRKLSLSYEPEEVEDALAFAKENGWMLEPTELSERVSLELTRKKKGHRYINQFLQKKGLPPVVKNSESELQKARDLAEVRARHEPPYDFEEQKKIFRYLQNRGFDDETIRQVIKAGK